MMSPTGQGEIIIRDFEPKDLDRVKFLFRAGMVSHVPTLTKLLTKHRLVTPDVAHPLVLSAPLLALTPRQSSSKDRVSSFILYLGAALVSSLGWFAYHSYLSPKLFSGYISYSIDGDISDIPSVYQEKGGVFLVAVSTDSDMVVGMVGGEFKHKEEAGKDGLQREVYEVRRLSVGPEARGKGLGSRLIQALQERVPAQSRMFADCSNIQPAAQRLYSKNGFGPTLQFPLEGWPFPFKLWRYEKEI
jgi:GNAT superfamily N-acetyltransferase